MTDPTIYTPEEAERFAREERWEIRRDVAAIILGAVWRVICRYNYAFFVAWGMATLLVGYLDASSFHETVRTAVGFAPIPAFVMASLVSWRCGTSLVARIREARANRVWS